MIFIAHRGNINGSSSEENKPDHVMHAIKNGFHAEIDVWWIDNKFVLGHSYPQYEVDEQFLHNNKLWCHAKTLPTLNKLLQDKRIHCFYHNQDDCTLTSNQYIWTYPGKELTYRSIAVMPEFFQKTYDFSKGSGICSDFIKEYQEIIDC